MLWHLSDLLGLLGLIFIITLGIFELFIILLCISLSLCLSLYLCISFDLVSLLLGVLGSHLLILNCCGLFFVVILTGDLIVIFVVGLLLEGLLGIDDRGIIFSLLLNWGFSLDLWLSWSSSLRLLSDWLWLSGNYLLLRSRSDLGRGLCW